MKKIMSFFSLLFCAVLSAATLSLAIPNELLLSGSALLGLFSLTPLYLALLRAPSFRAAGILCGVQIALVHFLSSFWLANFKDFAIFTLGASTAAYFALGIPVGWCLRGVLRSAPAARPFAFAACWICWEWLKSTGFLAYPWGTLPMTARPLFLLIQIADLTGTWGISFLLALVSAFAAEFSAAAAFRSPHRALRFSGARILRGTQTAGAAFTALVFLACCAYGRHALARLPEPETSFNASLIQQNTDPWGDGETDGETLRHLQNLTREALAEAERDGKRTDLVVWSESSLPYAYNINGQYYRNSPKHDSFLSFMKETGVPLFTGSPYVTREDGKRQAYNAVALINPDGEIDDWYAKIQLVPFAEYIPFTEHEFVARFFDTLIGFSSGWEPGERKTVFEIALRSNGGRTVSFTAPICFEDAFPAVTSMLHNAGGNFLLNLTNDSWSKTASAEYQHFAAAYFRAIELRTTLIRSTNGGFTAVILPSGEIHASLPIFRSAYLNTEIPVYPRTATFYARFGDWFAGCAALFSVFCICTALRREKRGILFSRRNT